MPPRDARTIAMIQEQQNQRNALRSGKLGTRLLDDGENNVGNSTIIAPQILPQGLEFTVQKQQPINGRILNLTAESKSGQSITIVMTAARQPNQSGGSGPLTGIIEFGNGTQSTAIEFDIPVGPFVGDFLNVAEGTQPEDSGAVVQVPTGVLRAYARYDNAYITPEIYGYAFGGPGSPNPFPPGSFIGPYAPNLGFPYGKVGNPLPLPPSPLLVKAFATYFGRHHSKLYKTQYLYIGNKNTPITFTQPGNTGGFALYMIPPFAKNIKVIPYPAVSMTIGINDQIAIGSDSPPPGFILDETYVITTGTYPTIPITGNNNTILIQSSGAGDKVCGLKLVYEIGF